MRIFLCTLLLFTVILSVPAQSFKVLHYTETSGFDHQTRQNSLSMLQNIGSQHGFTVDDDQTGTSFNSLSNLQQYAVVIFSNTSGDQILDSTQRANFEAYIQNGGAIVGIHAATDTYRHSTANGTSTGSWDWYAETLGASVQQSPNHTASNYNGTIDHIGTHPTTDNLPDPWNKVEEYYYWENGYFDPNNMEVLRVRSTGNQSYDAARPMSWYKQLSNGARVFYTALGHANSNFTSDTAFQNHIRDAILWAADNGMSLTEKEALSPYQPFPNPAKEKLIISSYLNKPADYRIYDETGKLIKKGKLSFDQKEAVLRIEDLDTGAYYLEIIPKGLSESYTSAFSVK